MQHKLLHTCINNKKHRAEINYGCFIRSFSRWWVCIPLKVRKTKVPMTPNRGMSLWPRTWPQKRQHGELRHLSSLSVMGIIDPWRKVKLSPEGQSKRTRVNSIKLCCSEIHALSLSFHLLADCVHSRQPWEEDASFLSTLYKIKLEHVISYNAICLQPLFKSECWQIIVGLNSIKYSAENRRVKWIQAQKQVEKQEPVLIQNKFIKIKNKYWYLIIFMVFGSVNDSKMYMLP